MTRVAFLTGAGSGIGRACARRLAADGVDVAVTDVNADAANAVAQEITAAGGTARAVVLDVTSSAAVDQAVADTVSAFGRVDVLVASAGIGILAPIDTMSDQQWHQVLDVDLSGTFYALRACARQMITQGDGGVLLSISSAYAAIPGYGQAAYCAAKSGIGRITECAAIDLGQHNIRVNAVGPGVIRTPLTGIQDTMPAVREDTLRALSLKRLGEPDDVANLIAFLTTDQAAYITGQTIYLDGGYTLRAGNDLQRLFGQATSTQFGSPDPAD